jgi:hypothetical protein
MWIVGVLFAFVACCLSNTGVNLQKLAHNRARRNHKSIIKDPRWLIGMGSVIVGSILDLVSYVFAPMSLLAPLGAMTLVVNLFVAPCMLGEQLTRYDVVITIIILSGTVIAVVFGSKSNVSYTSRELERLYTQTLFIVYICITGFLVICALTFLIYIYRRTKANKSSVSERQLKAEAFLYPALAGVCGAHSALFAKSATELVSESISGNNQFDQPLPYFFILFLGFLLVMQMKFLNNGLARADALYIVPIYQVVWVVMNAVVGMTYFRDFTSMSDLSAALFAVGIFITSVGVGLLSRRESTAVPQLEPVELSADDTHAIILKPEVSPGVMLDEETGVVSVDHTCDAAFRAAMIAQLERRLSLTLYGRKVAEEKAIHAAHVEFRRQERRAKRVMRRSAAARSGATRSGASRSGGSRSSGGLPQTPARSSEAEGGVEMVVLTLGEPGELTYDPEAPPISPDSAPTPPVVVAPHKSGGETAAAMPRSGSAVRSPSALPRPDGLPADATKEELEEAYLGQIPDAPSPCEWPENSFLTPGLLGDDFLVCARPLRPDRTGCCGCAYELYKAVRLEEAQEDAVDALYAAQRKLRRLLNKSLPDDADAEAMAQVKAAARAKERERESSAAAPADGALTRAPRSALGLPGLTAAAAAASATPGGLSGSGLHTRTKSMHGGAGVPVTLDFRVLRASMQGEYDARCRALSVGVDGEYRDNSVPLALSATLRQRTASVVVGKVDVTSPDSAAAGTGRSGTSMTSPDGAARVRAASTASATGGHWALAADAGVGPDSGTLGQSATAVAGPQGAPSVVGPVPRHTRSGSVAGPPVNSALSRARTSSFVVGFHVAELNVRPGDDESDASDVDSDSDDDEQFRTPMAASAARTGAAQVSSQAVAASVASYASRPKAQMTAKTPAHAEASRPVLAPVLEAADDDTGDEEAAEAASVAAPAAASTPATAPAVTADADASDSGSDDCDVHRSFRVHADAGADVKASDNV